MPVERANKHARQKRHHLSPLEVQAIFDARARGVKVKELSKQYEVSRQSIYNAFRTTEDLRAMTSTAECNHDGVAPLAKRRRSKRIPHEIETEIEDMKRKYPAWGVAYLREQWIKAGHAPLARASIYRILQDAGLQTHHMVENETFQRFEMMHPGQLWQMDVEGQIYLEGIGWVYGFAILDDYSRFCPGFRYFTDTVLSNGILVLNEAIEKYGVPEKMYTDNGSQFASKGERLNNFDLFCAAYAISVTHSKAGRPQGRGKIERFFETVENQFITFVRAKIEDVKESWTYTLEQLNYDLSEYLQNEYHVRIHGATNETPTARFFKEPLRVPDPPVDAVKFLERAIKRKVDMYGILSYNGYKIQVNLPARSKVKVVETIETIRIEHNDALVREINKQDLSKIPPVKRQDRTPVQKKSLDASRELLKSPSYEKTESSRSKIDYGPDKNGYYHRTANKTGQVCWMGIKYSIGKCYANEELFIQVFNDKLIVRDSEGYLVKTFDFLQERFIKSQHVKSAGDEASLAEPSAEEPLKPSVRYQRGPDTDGFYHRSVTKPGIFQWGNIRYTLGNSYIGLNILVQVVDNTLHVFDESGNLIRKFEIISRSNSEE